VYNFLLTRGFRDFRHFDPVGNKAGFDITLYVIHLSFFKGQFEHFLVGNVQPPHDRSEFYRVG
ncbi:hypothetical protein COLO4_01659, partial [Corchorus olitorius]